MIKHVSINGKKILINTEQGEFTRQFLDPIQQYLIYKDKRVLVLLNYMDYSKKLGNQNVYCLDEKADILWRIQDPFHEADPKEKKEKDAFAGIYVKENEQLGATTLAGYAYDIDAETGEVSNARFVK
jgi:hypothetical protein